MRGALATPAVGPNAKISPPRCDHRNAAALPRGARLRDARSVAAEAKTTHVPPSVMLGATLAPFAGPPERAREARLVRGRRCVRSARTTCRCDAARPIRLGAVVS